MFTIYYKEDTGAIIRKISNTASMFEHAPPEHGEAAIHNVTCANIHAVTHVNNGVLVTMPISKTSTDILGDLSCAVDRYVNKVAYLNGEWSSMLSARTAAILPGPFQAQALTLATWWSEVWTKYYEVVADTSSLPSVEDLIAALPVYQP